MLRLSAFAMRKDQAVTHPDSHDTIHLQDRLDFLGLDAAAQARLKALAPRIAASVGPALSEFYTKIAATPVQELYRSRVRVSNGCKAGLAARAARRRS